MLLLASLLWRLPWAVSLAWALVGLLSGGADPTSPRVRLLTLATCAAVSAHALFPGTENRLWARLSLPLLWGGVVMGGSLLVAAVLLHWPGVRLVALPLLGGVAVLTLLSESATHAGALLLGGRDAGRRAAWSVLALATTAPLWLGPWTSRFSGSQAFTDALVAVSPLTFLSTLAEVDYLRTTWFYEHSVFGSLRYTYPSAGALTAAYLLAGVFLGLFPLRAKLTHPQR